MPGSIVITAVIVLAIAIAMRPPREEQLIKRRPYNNRHSDATAARDGHV